MSYNQDQQKLLKLFEDACSRLDQSTIEQLFELAITIEETDDPMESELLAEMDAVRDSVFAEMFRKEVRKLQQYPTENFLDDKNSSVEEAFSQPIKKLKDAHTKLLLHNYPYK